MALQTTGTILDKIVARKLVEVEKLKAELAKQPDHPVHAILNGTTKFTPHRRFETALKQSTLTVISEIKRKSPSVGQIGEIADPVVLAKRYEAGGASCISCLTDFEAFGGTIADLQAVTKAVKIPVLRKDFTVDAVQIAEAVWAGASCVLLIVSVLGTRTKEFLDVCEAMGVDALVEVHDEEELRIATEAGARLIGVNNRNLKTFTIDLATSERLMPHYPQACVKVAESGVHTAEDAHRMRRAGFDAVLVGESLVKADDPGLLIAAFKANPFSADHPAPTAASGRVGRSPGPSLRSPTRRRGSPKRVRVTPRVKVCGVRDEEMARQAAEAGADFVGLVFHKPSKRFIGEDLEHAKRVAAAARAGGAEVWGVFTEQGADEIAAIANAVGLQGVQLHGERARQAHKALLQRAADSKDAIQKIIYVRTVSGEGRVSDESAIKIEPDRDIVLYDGVCPGSGTAFDWANFQPDRSERFFLAGGLAADNVQDCVLRVNPWGVDVSSGVEEPVGSGQKDIAKIRAFIARAKEPVGPSPLNGPSGGQGDGNFDELPEAAQ